MRKVIILGAGGRDFHTFNMVYRDNADVEVVCFTATQIPGIDKRVYPSSIAGKRYPNGIPIYPESELVQLLKKFKPNEVVLAYSDISYEYIEERRKIVESFNAKFVLPDLKKTMLISSHPVIAVCAVRTGAGKSPTSRYIVNLLREAGTSVVVIRHPMPYGDLERERVQRFATIEDMEKANCTIEEMEEYEPHIRRGAVVYAGVDYANVLDAAEKEAEVILWDGGNNDTPFIKPLVHITIVDPLRAGNELTHYPGRENFKMANVLLISKVDMATKEQLETVKRNIKEHNPKATVIEGVLEVTCENEKALKDKRVLVVEDGPTTTHGDMGFGAGYVVAQRAGAKMIDPRPFAVGSIAEAFKKYKQIKTILPALGYSKKQVEELGETIKRANPDYVVVATPIDLRRVLKMEFPSVRVSYELRETSKTTLKDVLSPLLEQLGAT
jgi:predicted GTPase